VVYTATLDLFIVYSLAEFNSGLSVSNKDYD